MQTATLAIGARLTVRQFTTSRKATVAPVARRTLVTRAALAASPIDISKVETATFGLGAALDAAVYATALAAPAKFFDAIKLANPVNAALQNHYLICAVGIIAATAGARAYVAAQRNRLNSDTYQRLTLSLVVQNLAFLPLMLTYGPALSALATPLKALLAAKTIVGISQLGIWFSKSSRPGSVLKDAFSCVGDVLTVPSNLKSALYSVLTVGAAGLALTLLQAPVAGAWQDVFTQKLAGAHLLAGAGFFYTLKNGADRNCLGRGTFKQINEAVAAVAAILGGVLYQGIKAGTTASTNTTTGLLALAAVTAGACAYQGVTAVLKPGSGGSVATPAGDDRGNYKYEKEDPLENYCSNNPDAEECKVFED